MRVLFHTNTINYRGTTVAITDYARYNQEILGNQSIIAYNMGLGYEKDMGSEMAVLNELAKRFQIIGYNNDLDKWIDAQNIDLAYFIRAGQLEPLPTGCKTAVHSVFQFYEPHGDRYAYISEWLSNKMTNGTTPFVPHIVQLPEPTADYRRDLGISPDQIVVGRYGGYFTFDIPFVKKYIQQFVNEDKNNKYVFLFVGTEPFIDHPNVKFINEIHNIQKKANFINTCDCMLHARQRGESFGLSIAEFLSLNKPVLAWNNGHDLNHIDMLKDAGTLYNDVPTLDYILRNIKDIQQDWTKRVENYKPNVVMEKFKKVFYD